MNAGAQEVIDEVISRLIYILSQIIENSEDDFEQSQNFKVRVVSLPGKYYLDRVSGSYEDSLHSLIHHLMWREGMYARFIHTTDVLREIEHLITHEPESIYKPDIFSSETKEQTEALEALTDQIDAIYSQTIKSTEILLRRFSHHCSEEFEDAGYTDKP
jgi:hypothetical protein